MNINKDNYQAFLLDLSEGMLSEKETEVLYAFLDQHPELDAELLTEPVFLTDDEITFPNKAQLNFENITPENRSFFFVGHVEKQLSNEAEKKLTQFLVAHPIYAKEFESYTKAIIPKTSDTYPNKKGLMAFAKTPIRSLLIRIASAAAILVFLFLGGMHYTSQQAEERYSMQPQILKIDAVTPSLDRKAMRVNTTIAEVISSKKVQKKSAKLTTYKTQNPTNDKANTSAHSTEERNYESPINNEPKIHLPISKSPRVALQLETVISALTPTQVEVPTVEDVFDYAKSTKEPLTIKEYLVAKVQQNSFIAKTHKKQEELFQLLNKQMGTIMGADQYIAKKEEGAVKTHISFGGFSFYRSRSVE